MATVYTAKAIDCPPLYVPSTLVDPSNADPVVYDEVLVGSTTPPSVGVANINKGWQRTEGLGRYGGGAYAACEGLEVTVSSGLTAALAAGAWIADGYRYKASGTQAITASTYTWLYVGQDGNWGAVSRAIALGPLSPPALPAGSVFRRRIRAGTTIEEIDGSGAFDLLHGGMLLRRTADTGKPTDTPSASSRFLTRIADGSLYLWDGIAYSLINPSLTDTAADIAALQAEVLELKGLLGALIRDYHVTLEQTPSEELADPFCRAVVNPYAVV